MKIKPVVLVITTFLTISFLGCNQASTNSVPPNTPPLISFSSKPSQTVIKTMHAAEKGNLEECASYYTKRAIDSVTIGEIKRRIVPFTSQIKDAGGIASVNVQKEEITGEIAEVTFTIKYKNGTEDLSNWRLLKEDGEWKVDTTIYK